MGLFDEKTEGQKSRDTVPLSKNLAEHWDLPNTGIFYSKDVASG
jgi:hypothetical protein